MLPKSLLQVLALAGLMLVFAVRDNAQTAGPRAVITQAIDENRLVTLAGNTRPEAYSQNDLGPVGDDLHLDMYLQLKRSAERDVAAQQFVESLTDKASPNFHKWITAAEYGQRFGAASEDIAAVSRWLESHGFSVNGVPANNMVIEFSGNAGQVREALHTEIHTLEVAGKRYFANMSDPQIPAALLPAVTGVVSLNNFKPHPMLVPKGQYTVNSYTVPIVPGDLATIYNLNLAFSSGYTGQGQTIVVVEDTDLYNGTGDWGVFRETFGLAQYPYGSLTQVHPAPGTGSACIDPGVNGDDAEAAIDVEWASAAAPNAAVVMASCSNTTNFGGFIALQNLLTNGGPLPSVVSISYGSSETDWGVAGNSYINTLYQTAAAAGVSVFVSSGDSGAAVADGGAEVAIRGVSVNGFASTTYNVAVGGTDFGDYAFGITSAFWNVTNGAYYNSAKSYVPEIPWNDSCAGLIVANYYGFSAGYGPSGYCDSTYNLLDTIGGSGGPSGCATGTPALNGVVGGTCAGYAKPSWQLIFGNPSDGVRDLPDIALFASNGFWSHYYVVCLSDGASCAGDPSTWAGFGGTSVSSPIMAGIQAVINQALGSNNVGNPNPVYYEIGQNEYSTSAGRAACNAATGPVETCSFNDITQGDMAVPCAGEFNCYFGDPGLGVLSTSNTSYEPAYGAAPGWDFATGIGSVNAFSLLTAFVDSVVPFMAPAAPALISPTNGATDVLCGTALTRWQASTGATSYDVYFGTASTPPFVTSTVDLNYAPGTLSAATTYYWAVGARNSLGANASTAWSFTTSCVSALNPSSTTVPVAGVTGTIPVTATTGCAWTAVSNVAWITITSGTSGSGNGAVAYTVVSDTGSERVGTITIAGQTFTVTQGIYPLISTLTGGAMPPTSASGTSVSIPVSYGVAVDSSGNIYFPSPNLDAVFKADPMGIVTRIAGTGISGYSGDNGPALSAQLNSPQGVALDTSGNLYIADSSNYRVRKVATSGVITTVAGTGTYGYTGDGGTATSARIGSPYGVALDASGNLFISDVNNNVIRRVAASGTITTVAGTGTYGYTGDGGAATSAEMRNPYGLAVDASGNLYIADRNNYSIRMVSTSGIITTVAGNGNCCYGGDGGPATSALLYSPTGVAVDAASDLYIADYYGNRIRKVAGSGTITTVAGNGSFGFAGDGGAATSAGLAYPAGVAVDASGSLYVADFGNARIRKVTATGIIDTLVGGALGDGGLGVFGVLNQPSGVASDNAENTYVADTYNHRVRMVAANGTITTVAGTGVAGFSGDGGAATSAQLNGPQGVALDASGNLYIADSSNHRVRMVAANGTITTVAGTGVAGFSGDGGAATSAQLNSPQGVALDASGNLYIADSSNYRVRKVATSGAIATVAGNGSFGFAGDGGAATSAEMRNPTGLAVDVSGNLYIADSSNYRVRMVAANGKITTVAGTGVAGFSGDGGAATSAWLEYPTGVAVIAAGDLYIADHYNNRIRKVAATGIITTVAGSGTYGYSGDGGPATGATFAYPYGVSVDAAGNVAVTDQSNNAVRLLTPAGTQPVLTIQSAHAGNFMAGLNGTYIVTVGNAATASATSGTVTVAENLPTGMALLAMSGRGWTCGAPAVPACTRSDALAGGSSYPAITVTVNVSAAAAAQLTGQVSVSGGGAATAGAEDLTLVTPAPALSIAKTHSGSFTQGQAGAAYTVTVSDAASAGPTSGLVTVTDTLPSGLTLVSMTGAGWFCSFNSCFRSDSLAASSSYPSITVTVNVASNATSPQVNSVSVSGGSSAVASATDSTIIGTLSVSVNLSLSAGGSATSSTAGVNETTQTGYATLAVNSGAVPYGTAVFSLKQNGVTVGETGVPSSPPTTAARIFIDYRSSVAAIPARVSAGTVDINTGIAAANSGPASANVTCTLRNIAGDTLSTGQGTLAAGAHFAKFIDQLGDVAPGFVLPANFQSATQFASLEISSDQPLSILALRMTTNQRNEVLYTTAPIADLTQPLTSNAIYFPQLADGGGETTSLMLLNTSNAIETGTLQIFDDNGNPLVVNQVGGTSGSTFRYSTQNGGAVRFQTDGSPTTTKVGWVQLTPDAGTSAPVGAGVFSCNPEDVLVTESGIPATISTTHARIYVDLSGSHDTGLAVANVNAAAATITISAYQTDGATSVGTSQGPLQLAASGHNAQFADQLISGLPAGFTGVLDIASPIPFAALTMRSLYNERSDFLVTTFPIADMTRGAPSPIVFPQLADGGGSVTQFILIGAGGASTVTLNFYGDTGTPLAVGQ